MEQFSASLFQRSDYSVQRVRGSLAGIHNYIHRETHNYTETCIHVQYNKYGIINTWPDGYTDEENYMHVHVYYYTTECIQLAYKAPTPH